MKSFSPFPQTEDKKNTATFMWKSGLHEFAPCRPYLLLFWSALSNQTVLFVFSTLDNHFWHFALQKFRSRRSFWDAVWSFWICRNARQKSWLMTPLSLLATTHFFPKDGIELLNAHYRWNKLLTWSFQSFQVIFYSMKMMRHIGFNILLLKLLRFIGRRKRKRKFVR